MSDRYLHDHDEELGGYWFGDPPPDMGDKTASTRALIDSLAALLPDRAYWMETGNLVREYLALQAGADYSETLRQGLVMWLQRSPSERRQYIVGDDMRRAALVDWYLRIAR